MHYKVFIAIYTMFSLLCKHILYTLIQRFLLEQVVWELYWTLFKNFILRREREGRNIENFRHFNGKAGVDFCV